jgi:hypothetical protein
LDPGSSSDAGAHDAGSVLAGFWSEAIPADDEDEGLEQLAPFKKAFPGLAPASQATGDSDAAEHVARELKGRLGLVAVTRPADALAVLGWAGPANHFSDMGLLSRVLRSWEERFGAHLVGVGFDTITLGVERPPRGVQASMRVAAEHFAACPDNIYQGVGSIENYAREIDGQNVWSFWWD